MSEQTYVRPEEARRKLNLSNDILRLWADQGKIKSTRTQGGHRRYDISSMLEPAKLIARKCVCYARVSSASQKEDLERQVEALRVKYPNHTIIQDVGSGLNFKRKGLKTILGLAFRGQLQELVVTYKDRLLRFGFELLAAIVRNGNGKIVVLNREEGQTPEQELCSDLIAITTVFTARIHGFRSGKNRKTIRSAGKESEKGQGKGGSSKVFEDKNISRGES